MHFEDKLLIIALTQPDAAFSYLHLAMDLNPGYSRSVLCSLKGRVLGGPSHILCSSFLFRGGRQRKEDA